MSDDNSASSVLTFYFWQNEGILITLQSLNRPNRDTTIDLISIIRFQVHYYFSFNPLGDVKMLRGKYEFSYFLPFFCVLIFNKVVSYSMFACEGNNCLQSILECPLSLFLWKSKYRLSLSNHIVCSSIIKGRFIICQSFQSIFILSFTLNAYFVRKERK
jgi:hypothetical protein